LHCLIAGFFALLSTGNVTQLLPNKHFFQMRINQQVKLTPRLSVSNEIANLSAIQSWTKKLSKSVTDSASGFYAGAANIIKTAPQAISTILHGETLVVAKPKITTRPAYICTNNTFPGVQVIV
jgi:hypothetical protein